MLVPEQTPGTREIRWHQTKPTGQGSLPERIAKKLDSEERLITAYGGTRVRMDLDRIPLWSERRDIAVADLWKAYCQFPYLPRFASYDVLAGAISDGASKLDWETETFAYAEGHDGNRWAGLTAAQHVTARPSGYLVAPDAAAAQIAAERVPEGSPAGQPDPAEAGNSGKPVPGAPSPGAPGPAETREKAFYGRFQLDSVRAIRQLEDILINVVEHLNSADAVSVELTLEINATSEGFDDRTQRVVKENATQLGAESREFE